VLAPTLTAPKFWASAASTGKITKSIVKRNAQKRRLFINDFSLNGLEAFQTDVPYIRAESELLYPASKSLDGIFSQEKSHLAEGDRVDLF
jgi:hypothetical protein